MGRYAARLQRLLGMPEDSGGVPFGSFRPADIPAAVMELVPQRLKELDRLSRDEALTPQARMFIAGHKFHTYEDFCLQKKQGQPGKKDYIGYGSSLERGGYRSPRLPAPYPGTGRGFRGVFGAAAAGGDPPGCLRHFRLYHRGDEFRQELSRRNAPEGF